MRTFQTIMLIVFGLFIVAGVVALATFGNRSTTSDVLAQAVVWGTLPSDVVNSVVSQYNDSNDEPLTVDYREFSPATFDAELINALAAGTGPDAIILSDDQIVRYEDKLYTIPFTSIAERLFRDTYIEGAELFINREGILALPIAVDPMVLYWNRTLLNTARIATPPSYWDELVGLREKLTTVDMSFNIMKSTIALGEYDNIEHAKEIIAMLIMQAGNPITSRDASGRIGVIMQNDLGLSEAPADAALRFYTEFADPAKPVYSWNRSLPSSRSMFLRGDLAFYVGFGSELFGLQEENPNLNFDLAPVPQVRDSTLSSTFGKMYGIALVKQTKNVEGTFKVATLLSGSGSAEAWAEGLGLAPARRDTLAVAPVDPYKAILYREALIASSFLDPDPKKSNDIFKALVGNITSGRSSIAQAVGDASGQLEKLFR